MPWFLLFSTSFSSSSCTITPSPCTEEIAARENLLAGWNLHEINFCFGKIPLCHTFWGYDIAFFLYSSPDFNYKLTIAIKLKSIQDITKIPQKHSHTSTKECIMDLKYICNMTAKRERKISNKPNRIKITHKCGIEGDTLQTNPFLNNSSTHKMSCI